MSEAVPDGKHWVWSCRLNACLGGDRTQPLCARAWEQQWVPFIEVMGLLFDEGVTHCEEIHLRWLTETASRAPGPLPCPPDGDRCGG